MFFDPFRQAVEIEMVYRGMSVHQLARASRVDAGHLRRWLKGWGRMSSDRVARLFAVLELGVFPIAATDEHDEPPMASEAE